MRRGIIASGCWILDTVKTIDTLPQEGACAVVTAVERSGGGAPYNVLVDLAKLQTGLPLWGHGLVGDDEGGRFMSESVAALGVDVSRLRTTREAATSFADVMTVADTGARTFFHYTGANSLLAPEAFENVGAPAKIFHLGYLLLLKKLDDPDPEFGTGAARALDALTRQGYKTSVDVISSAIGDSWAMVLPSLPYVDYLIINEIEAGGMAQVVIRRTDGSLDREALAQAARSLRARGVRSVVVIHVPEGAQAAASDGREVFVPSFQVAKNEIKGSVGAGDAFCAGMLYALHEDLPLDQGLRFANANARFNLLSPTSTGGARPLAEVLDYLKIAQSKK